ncbi:glycosyltransferase [Devosia sp. J2-20]|uniref:glycosyltransferase family 2 protein n=1 Tax=Devosia sp. J2-20 TaxID=3026161 RepID=UPI00249A7049|nr:glycosyltransferase [Devosia sp. J2-20]WDQ99681.1 glycosyltransferase [Devosia sp. J2-20]
MKCETLPTIAVVLACYNRKTLTLRCLESLKSAGSHRARLVVYLFDDGSIDGTSDAVREKFPSTNIIAGDGEQFWCGGMREAMSAAAVAGYDFLLWLNDDVELTSGFLDTLLNSYAEALQSHGPGPHVIVGPVVDPISQETTYSGFRRTSRIHPAKLERVPPSGGLQKCDTMNGNCVLFPASIVSKVGEIDRAYSQQIGDADYGYRCLEEGALLWVAPLWVGSCEPNNRHLRWSNPSLTFSERLRILNTPHGLPFGPWLHFMWRFGGPLGAALLLLSYAKWFSLSLLPKKREAV